jgi:hypothetical protein
MGGICRTTGSKEVGHEGCSTLADQQLEYGWENKRQRSVWHTRMVPCSAWVQGRTRNSRGRKGRLIVQARREGTQRGRGAGLPCKAGMHTNGKSPGPGDPVSAISVGQPPSGVQAPKGPAEQSNGSCSFHAPPPMATPAMIHCPRELGLDQDSRLIAGQQRKSKFCSHDCGISKIDSRKAKPSCCCLVWLGMETDEMRNYEVRVKATGLNEQTRDIPAIHIIIHHHGWRHALPISPVRTLIAVKRTRHPHAPSQLSLAMPKLCSICMRADRRAPGISSGPREAWNQHLSRLSNN